MNFAPYRSSGVCKAESGLAPADAISVGLRLVVVRNFADNET